MPHLVTSRPSADRPLEKVGPYRIEARLGSGGMGEVFRARHEGLDRLVALKKIRPEAAANALRRERFRREARAAARLDHPAIVRVYGLFEAGGSDWIVMELAEGPTLARLLADGSLAWEGALALARQITSGLAVAHAAGIIHRDLKAENIVVSPAPKSCARSGRERPGHAKILDFGIAKQRGEGSLTADGQILGTPRVMSPEQVMGRRIDHRSDLFSLGVLFYEMLTGGSPFSAETPIRTLARICSYCPAPVHECVAEVPRELSRLVDRLLEKDSNRRPQSAPEVLAILERVTTSARRFSGAP